MRIAICEDEEFIQNSIEKNVEKCLEITGMAGKCECFVSAEELLEKGNMPYALYILDVEMKKLSGLELAEHIRTEDRNAVIIFMTNHSEMMQKAFDVQAFQYLVTETYVVGIAGPYHTELKKWCHEIVEIPNRDALLSLDVITSFSGATYILDIFFALLLSKRYEEHARSSMEMLNHLSLLWDETYHTKEKNE